MTEHRNRLFELTYVLALVGLPIVAVVGIAVPLLLGQPNFSILGIYLAVPMILAPIVARSLRGRGTRTVEDQLSALDWRIPSILIHLLVAGLAAVLVVYAVRPTGFFVGLATVYGLVFLVIVSTDGSPAGSAVSLYHCVLALLTSIFSVTLHYDYFIGRTDLPAHVTMMVSIYETGTMPDRWAVYDPFPLWHTYSASSYALFGETISPHTTMVLLSGLFFGAGVVMLYTLARRIYPNETVALLGALVLIAIPDYVFYGMYAISRSIVSVLFIALLFTLLARSSARMRLLSVVFVASIVLYHTVSIPFVLVILVVLFTAERVYVARRPILEGGRWARSHVVNGSILLVAGAITSIYWLYGADLIAFMVIDRLVGIVAGTGPADTAPGGVFLLPWQELANYLPHAFLLFFVLTGFLLWFERPRDGFSRLTSVAVATVLLIPLLVPGPTLLLDSLAGINVTRFAHYGYMFLALTGGYGVYELVRRGGLGMLIVVLLVVSCFSFVALSNDFVASDNPVVEREFYTYYLTDEERAAFERLDEVHRDELGSDHITCRYYEDVVGSDCERVPVENDTVEHEHLDGLLLRQGELEERPLQFGESRYVYDDELPWDELDERNRVHDSDAVTYYR